MTQPATAEGSAGLGGLGQRVDRVLAEFVAAQESQLAPLAVELAPMYDALLALLAGGKRLRPAFCFWGWRAAGGEDADSAVAAAAALELVHACALLHDDVMDASELRRGQPSAHVRLATYHQQQNWRGSSAAFGVNAAILLGDLCLSWADTLLYGSGLGDDALRRGKPVFDAMRAEVTAGQLLDLRAQARGGDDVGEALRVMRYKTASYTVERPLQLGARLAGGDDALVAALGAYGVPLGMAFQLRDDLLGVFGDPEHTGKPTGDDLREGKRTVLVAIAAERADADQSVVLARVGSQDLGDDELEELRAVLDATGARTAVEEMIDDYAQRAREALPTLVDAETHDALAALVSSATARRH